MAETVLALFLMGLDLKDHEDEAEGEEESHFQHSSHNCNFSTIQGPDIRDFVDLAQFVTELRMTW